jgi:lauroyl/myristoyl acyltransferase
MVMKLKRKAKADALAKDAMNQAVESLVRAHPGQYLWSYARHKRPRQDD